MRNEPAPTDDLIDTRDLIELLDELESLVANGEWIVDGEKLTEEKERYDALKDFTDELESYCSDYHYGETLIADSYFVEYAEQLAEDIGAIDRDAQWPLSYIDWNAAADALKQDYTTSEWDGHTFYFRA